MEKELLYQLIEKCTTPAYIFDIDVLNERVETLKEKLSGKAEVCYAMKANPFLISSMDEVVDKFEVCSPGEFRICERNGIDMRKVVLSGVYKNPEDVKYVVKTYGSQITYTVESYNQFLVLKEAADEMETKISLLLRLSSGNQFGIDKATLESIVEKRAEYTYLDIHGIQLYSGTQKKNMKQVEKEVVSIYEFCDHLKETYGFTVREVEYGPGLYVSYFDNEEEKDDEMLAEFAAILERHPFDGKVTLEMGRFIASSCGTYITSIVDLKETEDKKYCIVDGGINHVNYYGQTMAMRTPHIDQYPEKEGEADKWNICGSLCTVGDLLVKQLPLVDAKLGDVLVFHKIGAYSITEGIYLFLSRDLPAVYLYSAKDGLTLVRETKQTDVLNSVK